LLYGKAPSFLPGKPWLPGLRTPAEGWRCAGGPVERQLFVATLRLTDGQLPGVTIPYWWTLR